MKPQLKATRAARELIKAFEPFEADAVQRGRKWTVGFGHRAAAKPGVSVSREEAELLLIYDVAQAETAVKSIAGDDLPPAARDALISFAASVGPAAFKVSDIARHARSGRHEQVGEALLQWNRIEQDGRLIVSERLMARREAEKTLYLEGVQGPALADIEPVQDEPRLGTLVDVEIEFEDPESVETAAPLDDEQGELTETAEAESVDPAPEPEPVPVEEAALEDNEDGEAEPESAEVEPEADPEAVETALVSEPETDSEPVDYRAQQDASVQAVMARMAREIATSIPVAPQNDFDGAEDEVGAGARRLGYSYLVPHPVTAPTPPEQKASAEAVTDEPIPDEIPAETQVTPTASEPVFATVSVTSAAASTGFAPPHPAEAPARAQGLSGEVEGPDHVETDEGDHPHDEDDDLDPALVAGPEASAMGVDSEGIAPGSDRASRWVYSANLGVGLLMTAVGGFGVWNDLDNYLAIGPGYDWFPIGALAAGILLTAASTWFLVGARLGAAKR